VASGLSEFELDGGFKDVNAGVVLNYRLTNSLNLTASGNFSMLLNDARRSPLVERRTQPSAFLSTSYSF